MALFLFVLFASAARADVSNSAPIDILSHFGATVGASYVFGTLQNSEVSPSLPSRAMDALSIEGLGGYEIGEFLLGLDFDYRWEGQLTSLDSTSGTNLSGHGWLLGIGAKLDGVSLTTNSVNAGLISGQGNVILRNVEATDSFVTSSNASPTVGLLVGTQTENNGTTSYTKYIYIDSTCSITVSGAGSSSTVYAGGISGTYSTSSTSTDCGYFASAAPINISSSTLPAFASGDINVGGLFGNLSATGISALPTNSYSSGTITAYGAHGVSSLNTASSYGSNTLEGGTEIFNLSAVDNVDSTRNATEVTATGNSVINSIPLSSPAVITLPCD